MLKPDSKRRVATATAPWAAGLAVEGGAEARVADVGVARLHADHVVRARLEGSAGVL